MSKIAKIIIPFLVFAAFGARAEVGGLFLLPSVGVVANSVQGTSYRIGLDLGYRLDENIFFGVGGYYEAGNHPNDDREIGVGPFVGYIYPLVNFLSLHLREDIDYVDQRTPVNLGDPDYPHEQDYGMISSTYAGLHFIFTRNFGASVGYRAVVGLSKASLADGRSGMAYGITIGF